MVLFIAASGGFIWWQQHQQQRSEQQVEQLAEAFKDVGSGDKAAGAPRQLDELSESGSKAVRASALFTRAALALEQNDTKLAIAKYREIANDNGLPKPYRDVALIRQTALEFDQSARRGGRPAPAAGKPGNAVVRNRR